jgi:nitronate monooxygenase
MAIRTRITELLQIQHPIVLAPMGRVAGGALAAAVSNAGGLGLVGGGYGEPPWLRAELGIVVRETGGRPWGAGLISWNASPEALETILSHRPRVVMLSFGDASPFVSRIREAGALLMVQVHDVQAARRARDVGADVIVAQGTEAGGHSESRATLPLVPAVVDAVAPTPVLAAGGIADGRGLAAALALGAEGVLIGTAFCATDESLLHARAKVRLLHASGAETIRTRVFDIVRGYEWPAPYTGRALRNRFTERWHGRERELAAALDEERAAFSDAQQRGDTDAGLVWAGEGVDLVRETAPAADVVRRIARDAERRLEAIARMSTGVVPQPPARPS